MTHIEDIKVGDWITITGYKYWEEYDISHFPPKRRKRLEFDGQPFEVVAISLPFIAAKQLNTTLDESEQNVISIDYRAWSIQRVNRRYVKAVMTGDVVETKRGILKKGKPVATKQLKVCPLCGENMKERKKTRQKDWYLICMCGFEGKVVKK